MGASTNSEISNFYADVRMICSIYSQLDNSRGDYNLDVPALYLACKSHRVSRRRTRVRLLI